MNKKRYFALAAAALLAVAPIATTSFVSGPMIVKASVPDKDATIIKLSKHIPTLTAYVGQTAGQVEKKRVTDVTSNVGKVSKITSFRIYPTMDNGDPDYSKRVGDGQKLKKGNGYVAVVSFGIRNLPDQKNDYAYLCQSGVDYDVVDWGTIYGSAGTIDDYSPFGGVSIVIPINLVRAPISSTTKINARGYVTVRKGHKVRTYTSTGKFSKHYVYGHKTYKLNQKKNIKGHGICYKIYGKNQWIPSKYLKF